MKLFYIYLFLLKIQLKFCEKKFSLRFFTRYFYLLAAANPIESQWNAKKTIVENIQLPHTLLSRFDLIFLILDPQDEVFDRRLGRHLVSLYYKSQQDTNEELVEMSVLRDYIAYAKQTFNPKLSDEAGTLLTQSYVKMRQVGSGRGQITAYPR